MTKSRHQQKAQNAIQRGFTLIEMMITVAIIGILMAVAFPSYQSYIIKSNRAAAKAQMLDLANREQQFLLANRGYATKDQLTTSGYALPNELNTRYEWGVAVDNSTSPAFTITFTAIGKQATDGNLTINSSGAKTGNW
jgi:type IV pilus assembly protein PilE